MFRMFYDRARIHVAAGAGGDGAVSFRREAHVPRGGPDGGDGGPGGKVVLVCEDSLRDLQSFKRKTQYRAGRGGRGGPALRHGAAGRNLTIGVPPGTMISVPSDEEDDLAGGSWELLGAGQRAVVARGGAGGKGNKRFATSTRQSPRFGERGLPGEERWLALRLKLLADVGLVGMPNAGKSSLLASLTRASPKVAGYPFTTLSPVLGVLEGEERQLVIADIPGLIEGASEGAGLGHDFLAHVERTRLLVHVLDIAPALSAGEDADPFWNHETIERELAAYAERLARLPRVLALSKSDLVPEAQVRETVAAWEARLGPDVPVIATSSATKAGVDALARELLRRVAPGQPGPEPEADLDGEQIAGETEALAEHMVFKPAAATGFQVERTGPRSFAVRGRGIEKLLARHDLENEDAMAYVEERLRRIGVLKALETEGFEPGDEIEIASLTFELDPSE
jgi:GTP-binding protein